MPVKASVVIPTYQGLDTLPRVFEGLRRQTLPGRHFEVVCAVDGSRDGTRDWLKRQAPRLPFQLRVLPLTHGGAGAARNHGVAEASAPLTVFLGDDVVPDAFFLAAHLEAHRGREPRVAVGVTTWHPALPLTPLLRRIAPAGELTPFHLIRDPGDLAYDFLYGSNVSLPMRLARRFPFDPRFPGCGWEDTELGYRLWKAGVHMVLAPGAVGYHWHRYTTSGWARRQRLARRAFVRFLGFHPEEGERLVRVHRKALENRERQVRSVVRQAEAVLRENRDRKAEAARLLAAKQLALSQRERDRLVLQTDARNLRMDGRTRFQEVRHLTSLVRRLESQLAEVNRNASREIGLAKADAENLRRENQNRVREAQRLSQLTQRLQEEKAGASRMSRDLPFHLESTRWQGVRAVRGWHSWENTQGPDPFRWSEPKAVLILSPEETPGEWEMDLGVTPETGVHKLSIRSGRRPPRTVPLKPGRLKIPLGRLEPGERVTLDVFPPGHAPKDPRALGIQLFRVRRVSP